MENSNKSKKKTSYDPEKYKKYKQYYRDYYRKNDSKYRCNACHFCSHSETNLKKHLLTDSDIFRVTGKWP